MRDPVRPNIKLAATIRFLSTGANYAMPVINRSVLTNMFVSCGEFEFQLDGDWKSLGHMIWCKWSHRISKLCLKYDFLNFYFRKFFILYI